MKLLWAALAAVLLAGCAIVPAYPVVEPSVSVGVGVPVYHGGYGHRHGYYGHRHPYYRRGW